MEKPIPYVTEAEAKNAYKLAQDGDSTELARVAGLIAAAIWRMFRGNDDGEDAIQDALTTVHSKRMNYHPEKGKAFSYLTTTIRHSISKTLRSDWRHREGMERLREDAITRQGTSVRKAGRRPTR